MVVRKALAWAALILGAAYAGEVNWLSDSAQFAVLAGLSAAAISGLSRRPRTCGAW